MLPDYLCDGDLFRVDVGFLARLELIWSRASFCAWLRTRSSMPDSSPRRYGR